jgi:hypothetical protein
VREKSRGVIDLGLVVGGGGCLPSTRQWWWTWPAALHNHTVVDVGALGTWGGVICW